MATDSKLDRTERLAPGSLDEHSAKALLGAYGVPVVSEIVAKTPDEAVEAAEDLGYPLVLKGAGSALQHKTERGLVHLHLSSAEAVRRAAAEIVAEAGDDLERLVLQPMVGGARELMAGFRRDPQFGPVIVFGLGGTLTEALDDVALGLPPLSAADVDMMMDGVRSRRILGAFRGEAAVRREDLSRTLMGLARLAEEHPEVSEVDINPLKVTPEGELVAVDALIAAAAAEKPRAEPRPPISVEALGKFFHPRSVAFIGASAQMGKWGHLLVVNTVAGGYEGDVYLVNPRGGTIAGREVYKSLLDVPGKVDLAVVTVPARHTPALIEQCREKGVRCMLLITSGFGEAGERSLEENLVAAAREAGVVILGPNTMGISNPHARFFCTGSTVMPQPGGTSMVSQSGNLGTQLLAFAEQQGLGIRAFAGSGNEAMVAIEDFLEAFEEDDLTRTVLLYLESVKNGPRFLDSARRLAPRKPILLLKGGQTAVGHRAAATHTGALTSDDRVFDAMCRQTGIIKVEQPSDLLDLAAAFSSLPIPRGPRTAIMTWGGGWGVVTADLCQKHGLEVPELDQGIIAEIDGILPPYWSRTNPVDLVGDQDMSAPTRILEALAGWDGCDAILSLGILGRRVFMGHLAEAMRTADPSVGEERLEMVGSFLEAFESEFTRHSVAMMERYGKPIIGVSLLADAESKTIRPVDGTEHQAVFYVTPEAAVKALSAMVAYQRVRSRA